MPRSNEAAEDAPETSPAITSLTVSGFKSIVEEQTIEIRSLTLLAGANGSGKSSMMQPLLLKQTLEAPSDPGPLLLDGPNVRFTSARQFRPVDSPRGEAVPFMVWLGLSDDTGFAVTLESHENEPITLASNVITGFRKPIFIDTQISADDLASLARPSFPVDLLQKIKARRGNTHFRVARHRFFLRSNLGYNAKLLNLVIGYDLFMIKITRTIVELIHLPGLRGNPERIYPVTAADATYRGTFDRYVAGLIARWGSESPDRVAQVSDDLKWLGLTWKIEARGIDETQVELRVGRLPGPGRGGSKELVNVADADLGVSRALPVVVALHAALLGQLVYVEHPETHLHPRA